MKTFNAKAEEVQRDWFVVDAEEKTLGRLASEIAHRLRGKHKAEYTPHVDTGDYIVVVNAEKIRVTGAKASDKIYYNHTGYPGGLKSLSFEKLIEKAPERVLQRAVKGMLPPPGPTGAHEDRLRRDRAELAGPHLDRRDALDAAVGHEQPGHEPLVVPHDAAVLERRLEERVQHVEAFR